MKLKLEDKLKIIAIYENGHFAPLISKNFKISSSVIKQYLIPDPDKLVYNIAKYIFNESNKKLHDDISILAIKYIKSSFNKSLYTFIKGALLNINIILLFYDLSRYSRRPL